MRNMPFSELALVCTSLKAPSELKLEIFDAQYDLRGLLRFHKFDWGEYSTDEYYEDHGDDFIIDKLMNAGNPYRRIDMSDIPGMKELDDSFPALYSSILDEHKAANDTVMNFTGAVYTPDETDNTPEWKALHSRWQAADNALNTAIRECNQKLSEHVREWLLGMIED